MSSEQAVKSTKSIERDARCLTLPIADKIETIAKRVYGADSVDFLPLAQRQIKTFTDLGYGGLPVCMAKTHLSVFDDPRRRGRPTGFQITVRELRLSAGAGFV